MSVLVFANNYGGSIHKNSFESVAYGKQVAEKMGKELIVAVVGPADNIEEIGTYGGTKVVHNDSASFSDFDPKAYTAALAQIIEEQGSDVIIFSHDYSGKSIAPRLSAKLKQVL